MDPLKPLDQILAALRSRNSQPESAQKKDGLGRPSGVQSPTLQDNQAVDAFEVLESRLRTRLKDFRGNNEGATRRVFVETVLANELGEKLAMDPDFQLLLDRVTDALVSHQDVTKELDTYIATLQNGQLTPRLSLES